jgi:N-acetylglucosaminyl-diphospho-decaprenol L-rhamnosyltransferase
MNRTSTDTGMQPDLSISIVDTDNREQTVRCLRSVFAHTHDLKLEVLVVDNACTDGSAEAIAAEFPQVQLIRNPEMLGFSTNNNRALAQAAGRYLLMLNDDTIVQPGAFDRMVRYADLHPQVGVVGANLLNSDGSIQLAYGYAPSPLYEAFRPLSERLVPLPRHPQEALEVDNVCGACLMVRREAVEQVGFLDPAFDPLYSEEVEWCFRFQKAGWKIIHLPEARVIHLGSQTMQRTPIDKVEWLYRRKALFFRKHGGRPALWTFKIGVLLSSLVKTAAWALFYPARRDWSKVSAHWHVAMCSLRF